MTFTPSISQHAMVVTKYMLCYGYVGATTSVETYPDCHPRRSTSKERHMVYNYTLVLDIEHQHEGDSPYVHTNL